METASRRRGSHPASLDIWRRKYRLRSAAGAVLEDAPDDTCRRVAAVLAAQEASAELRDRYYHEFLRVLRHGAIPGRILSNAGAEASRTATSIINCTVSGTIGDSIDAILARLREAGLTLKAGCGIDTADAPAVVWRDSGVRTRGMQAKPPRPVRRARWRRCAGNAVHAQ